LPLALLLTGLTKTFGGQRALDDASLEVAQGEVHGLLGQNGSGKSTLIKVLAGFHTPDPGGQLTICGTSVPMPLAPGAFRQHRISFVHQHLGLIPALTVLENMLIGRLSRSTSLAINWTRERRDVTARFDAYGIPLDPGATVADLSPVQRALLAIVRATEEMRNGDGSGNGLLILDEPTPFLPRRDVDQLFRVVRTVVAGGASVIFVSHDVDEVLEITDRATVLRDGRVAARLATGRSSKQDFIEAIVGRRLAFAERPPAPTVEAPSRLKVTGLSGGTIDHFDLTAAEGEVVGLTGLIGSGYDELPYLLYGARPASGALQLGAGIYDLAAFSPNEAIRQGIVLIPGDRPNAGAIGVLPVYDNVTMPVLATRFRRWMLDRGGMLNSARELGQRFDVRPADPGLLMSALSGGNQQKALLAKWLQKSPRLVLLDEPTQGVDIGARQNVFSHIGNAAAAGATVLCASSDYEQLAAICGRVLIFSEGSVIATLTGAQITKEAIAERSLGGSQIQRGSRVSNKGEIEVASGKEAPSSVAKQFIPRAEQFGLIVVWLAMVAAFGYLQPDTFLTWANLSTILGSQAVLVVVTLGLLIPLTANDFDLSIAYTMTLSSMLVAVLNVNYGVGIGWAIVAALVAGLIIGLANGLLITIFRIHSLIVTLGVGTFLHGVTLWMSDSMTISGVSNTLINAVIVQRLFGIPLEFYYAIGIALIIWYLLEYTAFGRRILFVGRGREVARLSGINTDRVRIACLMASGVLGGLAGILYTGTQGAADPVSGISYQLPAFAAAFLGSTCIVPGRFNPWGTTVAVYFLVTGITGLVFLGFSSFIQEMFYGGALVIAVTLSQLVRGRQEQQF
jgi:ABC-type sugar transport system ATPase subunit/ribose/xylose/arabinose/galactoside ABC-type transport system permease subunit